MYVRIDGLQKNRLVLTKTFVLYLNEYYPTKVCVIYSAFGRFILVHWLNRLFQYQPRNDKELLQPCLICLRLSVGALIIGVSFAICGWDLIELTIFVVFLSSGAVLALNPDMSYFTFVYTVGPGGSPDENGESTMDALIMNGVTRVKCLFRFNVLFMATLSRKHSTLWSTLGLLRLV